MTQSAAKLHSEMFERLSEAAQDRSRISGFTHNFYRYPARFSPAFAAAAIAQFSEPGDVVLDPYMGGGTVVVEAAASGRLAVGNDINSLSVFLAKAKTTILSKADANAVRLWANVVVPGLSYRTPRATLAGVMDAERAKNLSLPKGRFIKKIIAAALASIEELPSEKSAEFARCTVLNTAQWALDGRRVHTGVRDFRLKLAKTVASMLSGMEELSLATSRFASPPRIVLNNGNADVIDLLPIFMKDKKRAKLIVTSPPYPGVHVLYHRWQVDGRRETPAPYWIANRSDGQGSSYYSFGNRKSHDSGVYFLTALETLKSIRRVVADDGMMIQLIAFSKPEVQLVRYLEIMELAGFRESLPLESRIWRDVPNRKWHANSRGTSPSAREVLLVHVPA